MVPRTTLNFSSVNMARIPPTPVMAVFCISMYAGKRGPGFNRSPALHAPTQMSVALVRIV